MRLGREGGKGRKETGGERRTLAEGTKKGKRKVGRDGRTGRDRSGESRREKTGGWGTERE